MSCAARYQETPSFEFILNPFKFFFTNYVKKTRQTEYGQASLVDAVSVTYNLGPLATIEARINAACHGKCAASVLLRATCRMPTANAQLSSTTLSLHDALHATYLKLRLRARLRAASTSIICSARGNVFACNTRLAR
jgi:hypothetical protein